MFKLHGDFDPAQSSSTATTMPNCSRTSSSWTRSTDNFNGFPSSMIEGSYDLERHPAAQLEPHRHPHRSPPANQRYLVQLTITGLADQAAAQSTDIEAIIHGFVVAAK